MQMAVIELVRKEAKIEGGHRVSIRTDAMRIAAELPH